MVGAKRHVEKQQWQAEQLRTPGLADCLAEAWTCGWSPASTYPILGGWRSRRY